MKVAPRRVKVLLAVAAAIFAVHVALRLSGGGAHASFLVGMPASEASWLLGPLHVAFTLAAVTVAPICAVAAALEAFVGRRAG